ncbi:hypothetical protein V2J09_004005 [Rumex salicifolius]
MASALVLIVVFVLDVIAFALAVAAERRRSKGTERIDSSGNHYCAYSSDIATGMAVGAFVFLLVAQLIIMVGSRCLCCGRGLRPGCSRACAIILFIICWISFILAEVLLLAGSAKNVYHSKYKDGQQLSCETLKRAVFGVAAAFIVFTGILSEVYYVSYSKANAVGPHYPGDTGVRMSTI